MGSWNEAVLHTMVRREVREFVPFDAAEIGLVDVGRALRYFEGDEKCV